MLILIFVESSLFEKHLPRYLADEEYSRVQIALRRNPNLGILIPGSDGLRKLRWGRKGTGKRGVVRHLCRSRDSRDLATDNLWQERRCGHPRTAVANHQA